MERQKHPLAELIARAEFHRRQGVGIIRCDVNLAIRARLVTINVVLRQSVELFRISYLDLLLVIRNISLKRGLLIRELVVQLLQLRASGIVLVNAC